DPLLRPAVRALRRRARRSRPAGADRRAAAGPAHDRRRHRPAGRRPAAGPVLRLRGDPHQRGAGRLAGPPRLPAGRRAGEPGHPGAVPAGRPGGARPVAGGLPGQHGLLRGRRAAVPPRAVGAGRAGRHPARPQRLRRHGPAVRPAGRAAPAGRGPPGGGHPAQGLPARGRRVPRPGLDEPGRWSGCPRGTHRGGGDRRRLGVRPAAGHPRLRPAAGADPVGGARPARRRGRAERAARPGCRARPGRRRRRQDPGLAGGQGRDPAPPGAGRDGGPGRRALPVHAGGPDADRPRLPVVPGLPGGEPDSV
ncbi:MAG: Integral membrane protein, partial [uncultured Corynebacteriales bacterium]